MYWTCWKWHWERLKSLIKSQIEVILLTLLQNTVVVPLFWGLSVQLVNKQGPCIFLFTTEIFWKPNGGISLSLFLDKFKPNLSSSKASYAEHDHTSGRYHNFMHFVWHSLTGIWTYELMHSNQIAYQTKLLRQGLLQVSVMVPFKLLLS